MLSSPFHRRRASRAVSGWVALLFAAMLAGCAGESSGNLKPNEATIPISGTVTCHLTKNFKGGYIQGDADIRITGTVRDATITVTFDLKGAEDLDDPPVPIHIDTLKVVGIKDLGDLKINQATKGQGTATGHIPPTVDPRNIHTLHVAASRGWNDRPRGSCPDTNIDVVKVG